MWETSISFLIAMVSYCQEGGAVRLVPRLHGPVVDAETENSLIIEINNEKYR